VEVTSNADLQRWFDKANFNYFGNKLPKTPVRFGKAVAGKEQCLAHTTSEYVKKSGKRLNSKIVIYKGLREDWFQTTVVIALLHEMVHLKFHAAKTGLIRHDCKSGKGVFAREMKRLVRHGAFDHLL